MSKVLIVEDDSSLREFLNILLKKEQYEVEVAKSGEDALNYIKKEIYDVVITDLKMKKVSGLDVLDAVKASTSSTEVILITAYSTVGTAIEAMKKGAFDYIEKPFKIDQIRMVLKKCLQKRNLSLENLRRRRELSEKIGFKNIIGNSKKIKEIFDLVEKIANTKTSVLITGESGTGKELFARAVHFISDRNNEKFVTVNCGAIPENLLESELFGHVKGSFTGAYTNKKGMFEFAEGGTIFLDEISELPLSMQVKLLRVLQERKIKPVGGVEEIQIDVRIIAATNRDLEILVKKEKFREDLYYRLNVIKIDIPPLRERKDDIPPLIQFFIAKFSQEMEKEITGVSKKVMDIFYEYDFPGNIRELENIMERAVALVTNGIITENFLPAEFRDRKTVKQSYFKDILNNDMPDKGFELEKFVENIERSLLTKALKKADGVKTEAASILGISFRSMRYKMKKLKLDEEE